MASNGQSESTTPLATMAKFERNLLEATALVDFALLPPLERDLSVLTSRIAQGVHSIRSGKSFGFLPDKMHWQQLSKLVRRSRFATGVVSGHLSTTFLALSDDDGLVGRANELDRLSEAEFRNRLEQGFKRSEDPRVCQIVACPTRSQGRVADKGTA
jgi:hypothetical protein